MASKTPYGLNTNAIKANLEKVLSNPAALIAPAPTTTASAAPAVKVAIPAPALKAATPAIAKNPLSESLLSKLSALPQAQLLETTTLPALSSSMAEVSVRLTELEEKVKALEGRVYPTTTSGAIDWKDVLPSAITTKKGGSRKRRKTKKTRKNRRS